MSRKKMNSLDIPSNRVSQRFAPRRPSPLKESSIVFDSDSEKNLGASHADFMEKNEKNERIDYSRNSMILSSKKSAKRDTFFGNSSALMDVMKTFFQNSDSNHEIA